MALGVRLRVLDSASVGLRACVKLHGAPLLLSSGLGAPWPREEAQVNHSGVRACPLCRETWGCAASPPSCTAPARKAWLSGHCVLSPDVTAGRRHLHLPKS